MNYTYLCVGDRLPSVGVLQKLLNRTGAGLNPDGIFGPKTRAAVQQFQRARRLKPDGIVGEDTWTGLTAGLNLQIVDCVDVFDAVQREFPKDKHEASLNADSYEGEVADIRAVGGDPFLVGGMSNGVEQAIGMISAAARRTFLLRFHGHGYPGSVGISAGSGGPDEFNRINADSIPRLRSVIARLNGLFGPYGSIELMGCKTARGTDGKQMLTMLAPIVGVPVTAGRDYQFGGRTKTFRFEGPTRTAFPNGKIADPWFGEQALKDWCHALPEFPKWSAPPF